MKKRVLTSVNNIDKYAMIYCVLVLCGFMTVLSVIYMGNPPGTMKLEVSGAFCGFENWF